MGLVTMDDYKPDRDPTSPLSIGSFRIREELALEAARAALRRGGAETDALTALMYDRIKSVLHPHVGTVHGQGSTLKGDLCEPLEAALLKSLECKEAITYLETKLVQEALKLTVSKKRQRNLRQSLASSWLATTPFQITEVGSASSYADFPADEIDWLGDAKNVNKLLLPSHLHRAGTLLCDAGERMTVLNVPV